MPKLSDLLHKGAKLELKTIMIGGKKSRKVGLMFALRDRIFHKFKASKYVDQHFLLLLKAKKLWILTRYNCQKLLPLLLLLLHQFSPPSRCGDFYGRQTDRQVKSTQFVFMSDRDQISHSVHLCVGMFLMINQFRFTTYFPGHLV